MSNANTRVSMDYDNDKSHPKEIPTPDNNQKRQRKRM